jgi:hypothetical protein
MQILRVDYIFGTHHCLSDGTATASFRETVCAALFHLESAAFLFHIWPQDPGNYRIVASRVFFGPAVGFWLALFSQPKNGASDTWAP